MPVALMAADGNDDGRFSKPLDENLVDVVMA